METLEDMDFSGYYSQEIKNEINLSLKASIPKELPQLDLATISLYRRAGKSVYQPRRFGSKELDPHMVY